MQLHYGQNMHLLPITYQRQLLTRRTREALKSLFDASDEHSTLRRSDSFRISSLFTVRQGRDFAVDINLGLTILNATFAET